MAKSASLAAQSGTIVAPLTLPGIFTAPQDDVQARFIAPYITFAHPKRADEWTKIVAKYGASVQEGQMFLVEQKVITELPRLKCSWLCHKQFWAQSDTTGKVLATSLKELPKPWKEHIEAVLLVYFDDRIVPANILFRSTKCPPGVTMSEALKEASTPEWAARGQAYADTMGIPQPFMRFYGIITLGEKRISNSSGNPYTPAKCEVKPTSTPEWQLLKAFAASEAAQQQLNDAAERHQYRIKEMTAKLAK